MQRHRYVAKFCCKFLKVTFKIVKVHYSSKLSSPLLQVLPIVQNSSKIYATTYKKKKHSGTLSLAPTHTLSEGPIYGGDSGGAQSKIRGTLPRHRTSTPFIPPYNHPLGISQCVSVSDRRDLDCSFAGVVAISFQVPTHDRSKQGLYTNTYKQTH